MKSPQFSSGLFASQVALVTGGGTGIGFAAAEMMAGLGAQVVLLGRRSEVLQSAVARIEAQDGRAWALPCDIRDPEQVEAVVHQTREKFGAIHVLINNAGGQFAAPAETISPKGFAAVVQNNLLGTYHMTRAVALQAFFPQGAGVVVNVIVNMARGFPGMVHTGAARAGVENMTRTLAVEWASKKIRLNAVAPGYIRTEGVAQYPPELLEMSRKATPLKRLGTPEEVACALVFLASPLASFVTGTTLYVDGGAQLWGDIWPITE